MEYRRSPVALQCNNETSSDSDLSTSKQKKALCWAADLYRVMEHTAGTENQFCNLVVFFIRFIVPPVVLRDEGEGDKPSEISTQD